MSPIGMNPYGMYGAMSMNMSFGSSVGQAGSAKGSGTIVNPGESTKVMAGKTSSPAECQTCKQRKYQDGSDENVSFKSPTHISPNSAGAAVRAHEGEHVSNAYSKAAKDGGKVMQASVAIHTAVCPECGRTYVSGGTTTTRIKYSNEDNPYVKNMKKADSGLLARMNLAVRG